MRSFFFGNILILFCLFILAKSFTPPNPEVHYITQRVSHFNSEISDTYSQRYFVTRDYWDNKGPILFYTGNEGALEEFYDNTGLMFYFAQKWNALIVFGEHRYFGKSMPYGKESLTKKRIGFLSVEEALADYAELLLYIKKTYNAENSYVISFGGSYGGMLTAFFRMKYPHIVDASLAGSAPILVASEYRSVPGYFQTVTNDFNAANPNCPIFVRQAFNQLLELAKTEQGLAFLSSTFKTCSPLKASDLNHLILWIVNSFGTLAMVDYACPANFLAPLPAFPINLACQEILDGAQKMNNATGKLLGLAAASTLFYNGTNGNMTCNDIYTEFVFCADQTGCGGGPSGVAWDYLACTEIIYFPNTNNVTDMFPPRNWDLQDLTRYCQEKWDVNPRPGWLKTLFGGENINYASNIIFSNGVLDPWHGGGYLSNVSDSLIAVVIDDSAHHEDLRYPDPSCDPPSITAAREQEFQILTNWMKNSKKNKKY
eukprot:TRINITY_DN3116_c0_g1_i1.p1 TRINITY_DN3116_c0_g1~~TRINITY_DN3116_c0_g1_i1.p1  ORF type:complete len:495 (-),score=111.03 TRINITY_DN3116_c0_g1_i1:45-1499(-)